MASSHLRPQHLRKTNGCANLHLQWHVTIAPPAVTISVIISHTTEGTDRLPSVFESHTTLTLAFKILCFEFIRF